MNFIRRYFFYTKLGKFYIRRSHITHTRIVSPEDVGSDFYEARIFLSIPGLRGRIYDLDTSTLVKELDKSKVSCQTYFRKKFYYSEDARKFIEQHI